MNNPVKGDIPNFGRERKAELASAWDQAVDTFLDTGVNALSDPLESNQPVPNKDSLKFEWQQDATEREAFKRELVQAILAYRAQQTINPSDVTLALSVRPKPVRPFNTPEAWDVLMWSKLFKSMASDLSRFGSLPGKSDHDRIRYVFSNYRWIPVLCLWLIFVVLVILIRCGTQAALSV